jgi:2-iminobutanoate/2-iminopropanoate deaminase
MTRRAIHAEGAAAIGPYSHAVRAGRTVHLSGQTPLDPATGRLLEGGVGAQAERCFRNLFSVLEAGGLGPDQVVKVNVFLTDMGDFAAMNEAYARQFRPPYPARTTVAVAGLPLGARIEIDLVAYAERSGGSGRRSGLPVRSGRPAPARRRRAGDAGRRARGATTTRARGR